MSTPITLKNIKQRNYRKLTIFDYVAYFKQVEFGRTNKQVRVHFGEDGIVVQKSFSNYDNPKEDTGLITVEGICSMEELIQLEGDYLGVANE